MKTTAFRLSSSALDGCEVSVSEMFAVVGSEERDAVGFELVEGVFELCDGSCDVNEAG